MVECRAFTRPVGIMRIITAILLIICFSLVITVGYVPSSYWVWCMFTWCFCFFFNLLILILEFTTINDKLPFCWDNFTATFAILECVMCLTSSIMYPTFFTCKDCYMEIAASVMSWGCFGVNACEVFRNYCHEQNNGFLSNFSDKMKMLETLLACLIFISLEESQNITSPAMQWCVAVYSLCAIFAILIILLTMGGRESIFSICLDKVVLFCNVLALLMYMSAMVIWPRYCLHNNKRPSNCSFLCPWDKLLAVTCMTVLNFTVYTLDTVYSTYRVFK